jgi:CRISPR-associated protein Csb2
VLRALVATGYTKLGWNEVPPIARSLIEKLASVLPRYRLPRASVAHSRHYMPLGVFDKGREKTTLVLDSWAKLADGALAACWEVNLTTDETSILAELTAKLSYLGRAESWTEAHLLDSNLVEPPDELDVVPHTPERTHRPGWEQVSLMAAEPASDYARWRDAALAEALTSLPQSGAKKPNKKLVEKTAAAFPVDLLACMQVDSSWRERQGWTQPPGCRRVLYWRPSDSLSVAPSLRRPMRPTARVPAVLLALSTPSGNFHALPRVTRTLPQAELLHRGAISQLNRLGLIEGAWELFGVDAEGAPLRGHQHAHVLPLDLDQDGHLDHVLIWAPGGLSDAAQKALRCLRKTYSKGISELRVGVVAAGELEDLARLDKPLGDRLASILQVTGEGCCEWRSITPLVLPRYLKPRGRNGFEGQLNAELESRGLPTARVEALGLREAALFRHFVLERAPRRRGAPSLPPPATVGYAVKLSFEKAVRGPVVLGYGAHFGLGIFEGARE